jgi:hypothetical protein
MATTPNYGWVTPAPTDFVTDLPADFEVFADAVDNDLAGLLGGTTNQILAKDSDADHDFSWQTAPNGILATIMDAKGDLISATAADTPAILGVGTDGQLLSADSGAATGLAWVNAPSSGAYTQISSTSMNGSATIDLTSIPNTFRDLFITITGAFVSGGGNQMRMIFNNQTGNVYDRALFALNYSAGTFQSLANKDVPNFLLGANNLPITGADGDRDMYFIYVRNYTSAAFKTIETFGSSGNSSTQSKPYFMMGAVRDTAVISRLQITSGGGGNFSGGTVTLFGVK